MQVTVKRAPHPNSLSQSKWAPPSLQEKWVPFHTVLGPHDFFVVTQILHNSDLPWNAWQRFVAMFVFRAHCKSTLFRQAQLPQMLQEDFWKDPLTQFADEGRMTMAMLDFRRSTRQALQTGAFLSIPQRLCADDDENLARNVARRTKTLLQIAVKVWPMLQDDGLSSAEKFRQISSTIQAAHRLGQTWTKMLMVTIDIAYPELEILAESCNVGLGAFKALRRLAPEHKNLPRLCQQSLARMTSAANVSSSDAAKGFWSMLKQVELLARQRFSAFPLILAQVKTPPGQLRVSTVQVQLCEWRQFQEFLDKSCSKRCSTSCSPREPLVDGDLSEAETPDTEVHTLRFKRPRLLLSPAQKQKPLEASQCQDNATSLASESEFLDASTQLLEQFKHDMAQASIVCDLL